MQLNFPAVSSLGWKTRFKAGIREIQVDNARFGHAVKCLGIRPRRPPSTPYPHQSLSNLSCVFLRLSFSKRRGANDNVDNAAILGGSQSD